MVSSSSVCKQQWFTFSSESLVYWPLHSTKSEPEPRETLKFGKLLRCTGRRACPLMLRMAFHWGAKGSWLASPSSVPVYASRLPFFNYIETGFWKLAFVCLSPSCAIPGPDCSHSLRWTTLAAFSWGVLPSGLAS